MERPGFTWLEHPDVFLLASIIFVTKMLFPFQVYEQDNGAAAAESDSGGDDRSATPAALHMSWNKWQAIYRDVQESAEPVQELPRREMGKLRAADAWRMTGDQLDDYLDWYQDVRLKEKDGTFLHGPPTDRLMLMCGAKQTTVTSCACFPSRTSAHHLRSRRRSPTSPSMSATAGSKNRVLQWQIRHVAVAWSTIEKKRTCRKPHMHSTAGQPVWEASRSISWSAPSTNWSSDGMRGLASALVRRYQQQRRRRRLRRRLRLRSHISRDRVSVARKPEAEFCSPAHTPGERGNYFPL